MTYVVIALALGIAVAGFWNFNAVDGFGRNVVAANTIGDPTLNQPSFADLGGGFGFVFAIVAGLAATFTACNCVAFAMIPGLACSTDKTASRKAALKSLGVMAFFVMAVGAIYGIYVGFLGPVGAAAINAPAVRLAQASTVFSVLGSGMILWALIEFGFLGFFTRRLSPLTRAFFSQPTTKAAVMGIMVGAFAVGRPYPVFRAFLTYAAQAWKPSYGAAVMALQGLGQIFVMVVLFLLILGLFGKRIGAWVQNKPAQPQLVSAIALAIGGAYFVWYWGIALAHRSIPWLGQWGFTLGIYH
ncbi:MAG: hypothetical protein ACYDCK_05955 [Thermoplasmatota archaeon]